MVHKSYLNFDIMPFVLKIRAGLQLIRLLDRRTRFSKADLAWNFSATDRESYFRKYANAAYEVNWRYQIFVEDSLRYSDDFTIKQNFHNSENKIRLCEYYFIYDATCNWRQQNQILRRNRKRQTSCDRLLGHVPSLETEILRLSVWIAIKRSQQNSRIIFSTTLTTSRKLLRQENRFISIERYPRFRRHLVTSQWCSWTS